MKHLKAIISRRNLQISMLSLLAGAALTGLLSSFEMNIFEANLYDLRVRLSTYTHTTPKTALIAIDDKTLDLLGEKEAFSFGAQAVLIKKLTTAGAKSISFMLDYNRHGLTPQDTGSFLKAIEFAKSHGTKVMLGTSYDITGERPLPADLKTLPRGLAIIHKDGNMFAEDKVTRRAIYSTNDELSLHALIAEHYNFNNKAATPIKTSALTTATELNAKFFLIHYRGDTRDGKTPFYEMSLTDALAPTANMQQFKDKAVLVGSKSESNANDYTYTPFARELFTNAKLHVHAQIIETLINGDAPSPAHKSVNSAIAFIMTAFIVWVVFNTSPLLGVGITALIGVVYLILSIFIYKYSYIVLNAAHPLIGVFFAYYVFVPYRLIMEVKKRAELSKKNDVLLQVDELKRNFMSLITHDLKTPVAKMQGLAEMLSRTGADKAMVTEILKSADELNRFITSILELSKVESQGITAQLQTKDINRVIEDCARKHQFQAQARGIELTTELEPLFPLPIDTTLVSKILSNLIDNAIKYSPAGSQVVIFSAESAEKPGFIEIKVTDNGFGISDEDLGNLFHKFYRPKNDKSLTIKGYGLGLYLSRYFAELHSGSLEARSTLGKGSSFVLYLPTEESKVFTSNSRPLEGGLYA